MVVATWIQAISLRTRLMSVMGFRHSLVKVNLVLFRGPLSAQS